MLTLNKVMASCQQSSKCCLNDTRVKTKIHYRAIQVLRNAYGGGGCQIFRKKRYEGIRFNVTRGWGSNFQEKKRYVTLEWPLLRSTR